MKLKKVKRIIASALAAAMMITGSFSAGLTAKADSCGGLEEEDLYIPGDDEVIKDPALHWAVRSSLNAVKVRPKLTAEVVGSKQVKNISYALCAHPEDFAGWTAQYWISSLEGLQYAKSAKMIEICYTNEVNTRKIEDLSPLAGLTQLETLILRQDGIDNISPLSGLANLQQLDLSGNKEISDISCVSDMKMLKNLVLGNNKITSIAAVSDLEALEYLDVTGNQISGLPDLSKLKNVQTLKIADNNLTNDDVKKIAAMRGIRMLDIGNNPVTDIKPLARLIYLEKEKTYLPASVSAEEKENLFAAIEVNKLFNKFNISKMKPSDSENAGKAIEAYDALDDAQKAFIDAARVQAARDNKKLVDDGLDPVYYEEYDEDGEAQPVLDRLVVTVVDKNGKPMEGITFVKTGVGTIDKITDKNGMLEIVHTLNDSNWDQSLVLKDTGYVSIPEKIEYEVKGGKTYIVNGKRVTGFEQHQIMLIPKDEYVDKSKLEAVLKEAEKVEEEYKYTEDSYKTYADALKAAQAAYDDTDAKKDAVDAAEANLKNAIGALKKADVLKELKIVVKDEKGNLFTRQFKFQIYEKGTKKNAWNHFSDAETGTAYISTDAFPTRIEGQVWTLVACYEEPYEFDAFDVTVGVQNDGKSYYKAVDGQAAGPDFVKEITVKALPGGASDKNNERKPDGTVLGERIESAKTYLADDYTEKSYSDLQAAIQAAEAALAKENASQEDYNEAAAVLRQAEDGLTYQADTIALEKALERYEIAYTSTSFTSASWSRYEAEYTSAKEVYEDKNSTQDQVNQACTRLTEAERALELKGDKRELASALDEARALNADDYTSGYDALQTAIEEAQAVYDKAEAVQSEVNTACDQLRAAMDALVKKPAEINYECDPAIFRAKVMDGQEKLLSGVKFKVQAEGVSKSETIETDSNGLLEYMIDGNNRGKKTTVTLADVRYTTTDEHWFIAKGINPWLISMETLDGENYKDGTKLTYTLTPTGIEAPDPGPVDPDPVDPGPVDPNPGQTDKAALKEQIDIADSMRNKASDYTEESFGAMLSALEEAQETYADENATADMIAASVQKLKKAREELKAVEKPIVTTKSQIRILLKDKDGKKITDNVDFQMVLAYGNPILLPSKDGVLEYDMTDADQGVKTITVLAPDEGVEIGGEKYSVTPSQHEFTIQSSSMGVFITEIDGQELEEGGQEVSFVIAKKSSEEDPNPEKPDPENPDPEKPNPEKPDPENPDPEKPNPEKPGQEKPTQTVKNPVKVSKIKITGPSNKIAAGRKVALKAQVSPSTADIKNVTWTSSNTKYATVSRKGVVTLKKKSAGKKVTITATAKDGSNVKGIYKLTSMKGAVQKISITGERKSMKAGKTLNLKAKVTASKGAYKKVIWTSSNKKYASVSSSGKVKTYKAGKGKKVRITAKAADGSGKKKTVTIKIK